MWHVMVDKIAISLWNMFYYIVKITIYSAPLVLVILESEFDVIFEWIYVYMETVVWLIVV